MAAINFRLAVAGNLFFPFFRNRNSKVVFYHQTVIFPT